MSMYNSLNDAASAHGIPALEEGTTKIWYVNKFWHRVFCFGYQDALDTGSRATPDSIKMITHSLVGCIKSTNKEEIFMLMQGEKWSPDGEARGLIARLGLQHTSMSVGDVIEIDDKFFMVESHGFHEVTKNGD